MSTTVRSHKAAAEKLSKGFTFSYRDFRGFGLHVASPDPVPLTEDTDDFTREVLKHHNIRRDRYLGLGTRVPLNDAPLYVVTRGDRVVLTVTKFGSVSVPGRGFSGVSLATTYKYVDAGLALGRTYATTD